ncbi:hypothetical protein SAMN02787076_02716 [Rhizobacter sp. OV335]|nr:hypothetical protein SAMN02787076_02716 [Rhizobacter sp. OV335]
MMGRGDPALLPRAKSQGEQLTSSIGKAVKPDCLHPDDGKEQAAGFTGLLALPALAKAALSGDCR